ncbi:hypothetical protein BKA70DRAFT_1266141 [Coprinopsis sp. MPI-PUGE-AT-0042]|nr:hypothetical protein BKA70DRAFT_1266141 [Coprinopsis sp. MPI-PUGE-AT-0042]
MSSATSKLAPTHHTHSDDEPLPQKPPFDYSAEAVDKMKLPKEEMQTGSQAPTERHTHDAHCHSELHSKQPLVDEERIKAPKDHHFFGAENPRPDPVSEEGETRADPVGTE